MTEETKASVEATLREICRCTRKKSAEEKVRTPALALRAAQVLCWKGWKEKAQ